MKAHVQSIKAIIYVLLIIVQGQQALTISNPYHKSCICKEDNKKQRYCMYQINFNLSDVTNCKYNKSITML